MDGPPGPGLAASVALVDQLQRALGRADRAQIVQAIRGLANLRAPMGNQWEQLAYVAADNGEVSLARTSIAVFLESAGRTSAAGHRMAGLLAHIGAWDEALAVLQTLPGGEVDPASLAHSRGTAALHVGDVEQAREQLELATRLQPASGPTWQTLAKLVDFSREPELAEQLIDGRKAVESAEPTARGVYYFALGKAYEDMGEHALAFEAFARAARDIGSVRPYDRERDRRIAFEAIEGYNPGSIAAIARQQTESTGGTIFVTGLPRSGTTLMQQILTSHSSVGAGGEINRLSLFVKDMRGLSCAALDRYVRELGASEAARLWHHWMRERFPGNGRVVDKTVENSRMLGIAAALLPDAPIVWMRRAPLDCAWSCFKTFFLGNYPWSYGLEDIAFHFRLEEQLLVRWQDILGDRLLVVPYEELVVEPASWIPRVLAHCGLAEEPQVFAPHENPRAAATSSVVQVRQPINRKAVGAAEPYRRFLEPFLAAYGA
jgi:tetratricopeptide (TPR) repeat protein